MTFFTRTLPFVSSVAQVLGGIGLALLLFVPLLELYDTNDYNLLSKDPATGLFLYKKNSTFYTSGDCYENKVVVNNLGLHGPNVPLQKKENTFRILVVGSSYAAALQVPVEHMYATLLEKKLNEDPDRAYRFEVIPLALNQNGTFLDTLYYNAYGSALSPDMVIDIETQYELTEKLDNPPEDTKGNIMLQPPKFGENGTIADALTSLVWNPFSTAITSVPEHTATGTQAVSAEDQRWQLKEKLVRTLAQRVATDHVPFLFASWTGTGTPSSIALELPRHMKELASRYRFSYANLVPVYDEQERASGTPGMLPCDIHWGVEGNRYIAEALYDYLTHDTKLLTR